MKKETIRRLIVLVVVIVLLLVVGKVLGADKYLTKDNIKDMIEKAGIWGYPIFVVVFALGELVHIPGIVFVVAAVLAYGKVVGGILGCIGAIISVTFSFVFVRKVGGQALQEIKFEWIKKILSHLDKHPISTTFMLRILFQMAPPINYALALSSIRFRDYVIGSILGLIPAVFATVLLFEWILKTFFKS